MTEIDVPDWVVEAAMAAGDKFASENTVSMYATVRDLRREEMRAALEAGLAAMLEPVAVSREIEKERPSFYDIVGLNSQESEMWAYDLITLYRIKPE